MVVCMYVCMHITRRKRQRPGMATKGTKQDACASTGTNTPSKSICRPTNQPTTQSLLSGQHTCTGHHSQGDV